MLLRLQSLTVPAGYDFVVAPKELCRDFDEQLQHLSNERVAIVPSKCRILPALTLLSKLQILKSTFAVKAYKALDFYGDTIDKLLHCQRS